MANSANADYYEALQEAGEAETIAAVVSDTAYDATTWNGVTDVAPSKNAVRDKFEALLARTTVTSSDASTSPSASDSGKYYRLSNATPTFNLPASAGCTVGTTVFWVTATGGQLTVESNGTDVVEGVAHDPSDYTVLPASYSTTDPILLSRYVYGEFRYVASGTWALIGTWSQI